MCTQFEQTMLENHEDYLERFVKGGPEVYVSRENIRPTTPALTIDAEGYRDRSWSLIPAWSKEPKLKFATFNARAETITEKPAFRTAWKRSQRCVVPATAYGEWPVVDGKKQRHRLLLKGDVPLMFGGLWERWQQGKDVRNSFTIVTVQPVTQIAWVHHRMPLMLKAENVERWLHAAPEECEELLQPQEVGDLKAEPIEESIDASRRI